MFASEPIDGDDRRGFNRGIAYAVSLLAGTVKQSIPVDPEYGRTFRA